MSTDMLDLITPTEAESRQASESGRQLARVLARSDSVVQLRIVMGDQTGETLVLPVPALQLLKRILTEMGQGHAVSLIPLHAELTTQQAADYLNVSRPYLIRLLQEGAIPFRLVGTHRRVKFSDLLDYKRAIDEAREATLKLLTREAQDLDLGY